MSEFNDNNDQNSSQPNPSSNDNSSGQNVNEPTQTPNASSVQDYNIIIKCLRQFSLLGGSISSGTIVGMIISLLLSLLLTPIIFYAFNSNFSKFDEYFEPKKGAFEPKNEADIHDNGICVLGKDKKTKYWIDRESISPTTSNNNKEYRYKISSENETLFTVIISDKSNRIDDKPALKAEDIRQLTIDVAKPDLAKNSEEPDSKEKWYETSNIAKTNSIFEKSTKYLVLTYQSYPTSITAFISWIKDYGKDELELTINNDDIQKIASALERALENDWLFQEKNRLDLLISRSINGSIQFLCVLLFNAIAISLLIRYIVIIWSDPVKVYRKQSNKNLDFQTCNKLMDNYKNRWGLESPTLWIYQSSLSYRKALEEKKNGRDSIFSLALTEMSDYVNNAVQTSYAYIFVMKDAIPIAGFAGTLIGIGRTMLNISEVISNDLGKQQSRITEVSLHLAFAFDTTLIALILSIIIDFFITFVMNKEEKIIHEYTEDVIQKNVELLNETTKQN